MKMRLLAIAAVMMACLQSAATTQEPVTAAKAIIADVSWIGGAWTGGSGAVTIEEHWTAPAAGAMLGVSRTVRGPKMVAFEFLRIIERNGGLVYIAQPNGRAPATEFVMTAIDAQGVTFENPAHDFPKVIRYAKRAGGGLDATISGAAGSKSQTFTFERVR
jgi:hypothetical protein